MYSLLLLFINRSKKSHIGPHSMQMCEVIISTWMDGTLSFSSIRQAKQFQSVPWHQCLINVNETSHVWGQVRQDPFEVKHLSFITFRVSLFKSSKRYPYKWWRWSWWASIKTSGYIRYCRPRNRYTERKLACKMSPFAIKCLYHLFHLIWPHRFRHKQISNGESKTNKSR